jgi:hypothetical protein
MYIISSCEKKMSPLQHKIDYKTTRYIFATVKF